MADTVVEQLRLEVVEPVDVGLNANEVASNVLAAIVTSQEVLSENGVHLEKIEGPNISNNFKIDDVVSTSDVETTDEESESEKQAETEESSKNDGEILEEEIVELEFEKVKPKLETHSMHCPNCKAEVTKVILRRKVISYRPIVEQPLEPEVQPGEPKDLVGCFSCLSLFTFSDNGCFNPFDIFRKSPSPVTTTTPPPPANSDANKLVIREKDNCLSMFWVFGKEQNDPNPEVSRQPDSEYIDQENITPDPIRPPKYVTGTTSIAKGFLPSSSNNTGDFKSGFSPSPNLPSSTNVGEGDEVAIVVHTESEAIHVVNEPAREPSLIGLEILKSIVYGGLLEAIASLSVVASAAASKATTLNIVALSLASVIGGILIIGHNLWDLKDDCTKQSLTEEATTEATNKYTELLGRVNYFPLHTFFAILSFVVFGMVPPVAYGYSFYKTDDKDYTVVVVAIASILCVTLLATCKAYINKCTVLEYFKTVVYYIITTVAVSGVSYVAGNLVTRLIEELGLFDTGSSGGVFFPGATDPSFASF